MDKQSKQQHYIESLSSSSSSREKRCLDTSLAEQCEPENKRPALSSVIVEALKVDSMQKFCLSLEPILRRVVSEEVERALANLCPAKLSGRSSPKRIAGPDGRTLQLHLRTRLSLPLFTGGKVEGEQGAGIHVVLIDANTGRAVTSGPESAVKLDIVVLEGDFNNADDDNWTQEEFESHIVKEREGKRPLLGGDLQVTLEGGVGTIRELTFTDNSSWIRSRKFRLGLKVASGYCEGIRIREAKSEAFTVKDHRGELYKKHYPPALHDEVWRLEKIGKDGSFHKRLNKAGVYTVEDFLRLVVRDSQRLRNILGSGMSNKMWEVLLEHAKTCIPSGKLYVYYPDEARNLGVVFNNIHELIGLIANGQFYSTDSLSENQKVFVDTLANKAYENWVTVVECDTTSLQGPKQSTGLSYPQADAPVDTLPVSVPSECPSGYSGYGDNVAATYTVQSQQNVNLSAPVQYGGAQCPQQNSFSSASLQAIAPESSDMGAISQQQCIGQQQSSTPVFQAAGPSNPTTYRAEEIFPEEGVHRRSHYMLENEDMQHLHRTFNLGSHHHASYNVPEDVYPYSSTYMPFPSPNYSLDDDPARPSSKAVVGWLKLKAALRWGIFVRKKAAERRAELVELDEA